MSDRFNPFPGLRPFRSDESHLFFGREDQSAALLQLLRKSRFLAVVGTSGSGKSSLVRAGLIPELHGGTMAQAGSSWEVVLLRPGGSPFENVSRALLEADLYDRDDPSSLPRLGATLSRSRYGLVEAVKQSDIVEQNTNVLIVVDQFEELFRFRQQSLESEEVATAFVNLLLTATAQEERQVYVTITMRSDYLGDCSEIPGLAEAVNNGEYLIPRLQRDQKQDAIMKPVGVGGAKINPLLVQRLLNDIGDDPDQLPVLQHALMRMWDGWAAAGDRTRAIDFDDLEATGGLTAALSRHADEIYDELPDDAHRSACERVFKTLTEKGGDNRGIRRPTRLERLETVADTNHATIAEVIDAFRKPGVTFLMPGVNSESELSDRTVVDLSHESLMRGWERLRTWVEEEAQSARIFKRLSDTASLWRDGKAGLFRDPDLQIALSWREEERPNPSWAEQYGGEFDKAITFLEQSREEAEAEERTKEAARQRELAQARQLAEARERAARSFRRFAIGMGVVAVVAVAAFVFAIQKRKEAERLRIQADSAKEELRSEFVRTDMSLGHFFADEGDVGRGIAHLARSLKPDRKPDNPGAVDRIFNLLAYSAPPGHRSPPLDFEGGEVYATAATANGSLGVTGTWGRGDVRWWTPGSATMIPSFEIISAGDIWHNSLAISPGEDRLLVGFTHGDGALYDCSDWSLVREIPQPGMHFLQFSVDGRRFLSSSWKDRYAIIWDTETGQVLDKIDCGKSSRRPRWSPNETRILMRGPDGAAESESALLVDLATGGVVADGGTDPNDVQARVAPVIRTYPVNGFFEHSAPGVFSPDGTRILIRARDAMLWVWSTQDDSEPVCKLVGHQLEPVPDDGYFRGDQPYTIAAFSPDGQRVISAGTDMTIRYWDVSDGVEDRTRHLDSRSISTVIARESPPIFSRDGRRVMVPTRDGRCYYGAFAADAPDELPDFAEPPRPINEGYAFLADAGEIKPLYLPQESVTSGALHPNQGVIALATATGRVALFDLKTGERLGSPLELSGEIVEVAFNGDGSEISARSDAGKVRIWEDGPGWKIGSTIATTGETTGSGLRDEGLAMGDDVLASSADRSRILTARNQVLGSTAGAKGGVTLELPAESVAVAAFSPDAEFVVTASGGEGSLRVWSAANGERWASPAGPKEQVVSLDLSSGGEFLAAGYRSGQVHLWGLPLGNSNGWGSIRGDYPCQCVVFSPDGRLLATVFTGAVASYAQVWEAETGQPVSGRLETGSTFSDAAFIDGGNGLVVWPQQPASGRAGIAAVWDVSISGGQAAPAWLHDVATSFGGNRLDAQSVFKVMSDREAPPDPGAVLSAERRLAEFFQWLGEFPGTRPDSPFRPDASDAYVETLVDQSDLALLDEAVRLRPHHPRALARRGILRRVPANSNTAGVRALSTADLTRARLLSPNDAEIWWYQGIALEADGKKHEADEAYAEARRCDRLDFAKLLAVIDVQNRYQSKLREDPCRDLLTEAIDAAGRADGREVLAARLQIQRYSLSSAHGNFEQANKDWQIIVEMDPLPPRFDPDVLLANYLRAAQSEAERLIAEEEDWDAAIRLMSPLAVVSELEESLANQDTRALGYWNPTPALSLLVEWDHRAMPPVELVPMDAEWRYLDDGSDQGTAWRASDFNDTGWKGPGRAKLGYGGDGEVTTIGFGPDPDNKFSTAFFRRTFEVREGDVRPFLDVNLIRDDGAIVYLNGVEVLRENMSPGEVKFDDFASRDANANDASSQGETRAHRFTIDARSLRLGRNVLAAEVHQRKGDSSDLGFALQLLGSDHAPGSQLAGMLEGDGGAALREAAIALLPKSLRSERRAVLERSLGQESAARARMSLDAYGASFRLCGLMAKWEEALEIVEEVRDEPGELKRSWMERHLIALERLGRKDEARTVRHVYLFPKRLEGLDARLIDLSKHYNASLYDGQGWSTNPSDNLARLPESFVPLKGANFDLRGVVQLESGTLPDGETYNEKFQGNYPLEVTEIKIGQMASAIHFLTSCHWGRETRGVEVARFVIHYKDAPSETKPVNFIDDIADWYPEDSPDDEQIGWRGWNDSDRDIILSELVWINPRPDETIETIDFISAGKAAAPFLVGITLE